MDATKVLVLLIQLVGSKVVECTGDVVKECFDRLDEYHRYHTIIEGLIDILREVVQAIHTENVNNGDQVGAAISKLCANEAFNQGEQQFEGFFCWYVHQHDPDLLAPDEEDVGPVPQTA